MNLKSFFGYFLVCVLVTGCAGSSYNPEVVVDTSKVKDLAKYKEDKAQCIALAKNIDLNSEAATKALAGAAAGGVAVAGVATAVAGAVFLPALPFIAAGTALGGGAMGYGVKAKERRKRDAILGECLRDRGYTAYTGD